MAMCSSSAEVRQEASNGGLLYHEVQESKLCALHCVNTVLQGPFFSEIDLAEFAADLDRAERQVMAGSGSGDYKPEVSHNVSLEGDFSIQVLQKALEVWSLQVIPLDCPAARAAQMEPEKEKAYICHLHDHWFCIRKVNGEWYNFDSMYPAPEHLSCFYLSACLDSFKISGWSIFLVRGFFPDECPIVSSGAASGYGQWLLPEDAKRMNGAVAAGLSLQQPVEPDEDEDLRAAIAASLEEWGPDGEARPDSSGNQGETVELEGKGKGKGE